MMDREKEEDDDKKEKEATTQDKDIFGFYKDDKLVEPFLTKTIENNMMKYILGKVKYTTSYPSVGRLNKPN